MSLVESNFAYRRGNVSDRLQMWIDGVGGFMLLLSDRVHLGQAMASAQVDVPIMGDISRRHAAIRRSGSEYILEPFAATAVNGRQQNAPVLLKHHDELRLGRGVQLRFVQPHPLSTSAVLNLTSRHRTEPAADGVVLVADSLLLGPKANNHIVCPHWQHDVVLYRHGHQLQVKSKLPLFSGNSTQPATVVPLGEAVQGGEISFCLEPLGRG